MVQSSHEAGPAREGSASIGILVLTDDVPALSLGVSFHEPELSWNRKFFVSLFAGGDACVENDMHIIAVNSNHSLCHIYQMHYTGTGTPVNSC